MTKSASLILASASSIRRTLLENAGVTVEVDPASIDEGKIRDDLRGQGALVEAVAIELAARKAAAVAERHSGRLVIGADQILEQAGTWFEKPADRAAACRQLETLSGRPHRLVTGAVIVEDGREVWRFADSATLFMRPLKRAFIEAYLGRLGAAALQSVGAYQFEGLGAQLFEKVEGDYFTVLGLPLLPLLAFLRRRGVVPE